MKKVITPPLKEIFGFYAYKNQYGLKNDFLLPINQYYLSALVFIFIIPERISLLFGLTMFIYPLFLYFRTLKIAKELKVKRLLPILAREYEQIKVEYIISNYSAFDLNRFHWTDNFEGIQEGIFKGEHFSPLTGGSRVVFYQKLELNGGMGKKNADTFSIYLTDLFGFFPFKVIFDLPQVCEVYPKLEGIPEIPLRKNLNSFHFGNIDIAQRGDSVNFFGTKPYQPGDPVRRINWRQSVRSGHTIVNLFEKNINRSMTIGLNLSNSLHSGEGQYSTFEYAKDYCLSFASQCLTKGDEVSFFTNDRYYPRGTGQGHINHLEMSLFQLELIPNEKGEHFIHKHQSYIENEIFTYITPLVPGTLFTKNIKDLIYLSGPYTTYSVIIIDPFPYLSSRVKIVSDQHIKGLAGQAQITLDQTLLELRSANIPYQHIVINENNSFKENVLHSLRRGDFS